MEKVEKKAVPSGNKIEEFLAYDERGNPVVLRRSTSMANATPETASVGVNSAFGLVGKREPAARPTGSLRFFAGFEEVKARLQAKVAAS